MSSPSPQSSTPPGCRRGGVSILWEDEHILAVDKPAGLLAIQDGYDPAKPHLDRLLEADFGRLWIVHRLDKDTSGVMILARTARMHRLLNMAFEARQVHKTYHGLVGGSPPWDDLVIDHPLRVDGDRRHRTIVDARIGKPAETRVHVIERFESTALVSAQPLSGYTHQIRAHLAAAGFPLLCDALYGGRMAADFLGETENAQPMPRVALHAWQIDLLHPITREGLLLQAGYPEDFSALVEAYRRLVI